MSTLYFSTALLIAIIWRFRIEQDCEAELYRIYISRSRMVRNAMLKKKN